MRRVRRVPAADNEDEIQLVFCCSLRHLCNRVLPHLCGITNGVEGDEIVLEVLWTVRCHHSLLEETADRLCFLLVHSGLIGDAYLLEVLLRVKVGRGGMFVLCEKLFIGQASGLLQNVGRDLLRLFHVLDDQVCVAHRRSRNCLLVLILAVNDGSHLGLLVLVNDRPDLGDPRACSVNSCDALLVQELHLLERGTEGRQDDNIALTNRIKPLAVLRVLIFLNELDVHSLQQVIDSWVVDQFVCDMHGLVWVRLARRPRQFDRALDPPAEAKLLGEHERHCPITLPHGYLSEGRFLHLLQDLARKLGAHLLLDTLVDRLVERGASTFVLFLAHDSPPLILLVQHLLR
mmetsp:Transcript_8356/g.17415  ORF Transcript_8356/g.17415 Transcript_8356/m.17415 type:complete len:346 (-) Transcript_8356:176-1213(-)